MSNPINRVFELLTESIALHNKPDVFASKINGEWVKVPATDFIESVNSFSYGLLKLGVKKGDKIAVISESRPEWNIIDFGMQQVGAVNVPLYPNITVEDYRYIFQDAGVSYVFTGDQTLYERAKEAAREVASVKTIFTFDKISGASHWKEVAENETPENKSAIEEIKKSIRTDDLLTLIYTSGTTGRPKGVMLSHQNLISNFEACKNYFPIDPSCKALSFLPLNHVYERMVLYLYMRTGTSIYYAQNMNTIAEDLKDVQPQIFTTVPRLLEKVYDKIVAKGYELSGLKRRIFFRALELGLQYDPNVNAGWWYNVQLKLMQKLVFSKWQEALGGNIRLVCSGAAALQPRLARVFWAAGIPVSEGYGMTEASPVIATNRTQPLDLRIGTVGPIIDGGTVKIADDGEILFKGPNVMLGYYNLPELTHEAIDADGWLHTGDIGKLEEGRYLKITDRKKEIFKTSGGKYVAPQVLENKIKESVYVEQIIVVGEGEKFPSALIVPEFTALKEWCAAHGILYTTDAEMAKKPEVHKLILDEVHRFNKEFAPYEQVKKIELLPKAWTIEDGEITPTLKPKRKVITQKYKDLIEGMYL
ncbi:AMP-dependent synthetase/ligase [Emticicia fluvialis]|uniref:AMP-dependent synthetase/ligase n=1 Tax=Emticicia fluvialis TaxID=2974474 RepID=UPI002165BE28|nr:AMP-dependent synthetase/ligase [Emticicia fluvialis]